MHARFGVHQETVQRNGAGGGGGLAGLELKGLKPANPGVFWAGGGLFGWACTSSLNVFRKATTSLTSASVRAGGPLGWRLNGARSETMLER